MQCHALKFCKNWNGVGVIKYQWDYEKRDEGDPNNHSIRVARNRKKAGFQTFLALAGVYVGHAGCVALC